MKILFCFTFQNQILVCLISCHLLQTQGPNNGQLVVRVFGSGFPQADDLRVEGGGSRIVPNEAVQVLIDGATDNGGVSKAIQGYDNAVRIISENALEVRQF